MAINKRPSLRQRFLGAELRRFREAAKMTLDAVGKEMDVSDASISRLENAQVRARVRDVAFLLDLYGVTDTEKREALITLARDVRKTGWWSRYAGAVARPYVEFVSLEAEAGSLWTYEPQLIPGLLQTEGYLRAMIETGQTKLAPERVETLVEVRKTRQQVFDREPEPLRYWAVLDEAALHRVIGGEGVMREQFKYMVDMADRSNVTVQVLPYRAGMPTWVNGPFNILEFPVPADLSVVCIENLSGTLYLEEDQDIERYTLAFRHLSAAALSPKDSRELIEKAAKTHGTG